MKDEARTSDVNGLESEGRNADVMEAAEAAKAANGGSGGSRDVGAGLRRVPELEPVPLPESDPELVARLRAEIERDGPMTFARFMELALYDPERGYYTRRDAPDRGPGRTGDFLTAPESHPIFGEVIARHLDAVWATLGRPARFVLREHGAGSGALAAGILGGLRRSGSPLGGAIRYQPIEASPARLEALGLRLAAEGLEAPLEPATDQPEAGAILANELLDALPVHRVEGGPDGELLERFVRLGAGGAFEEAPGEASRPALAERLEAEGIRLEPGQVAEVCLALDGWVARAAAPLERGELLLIDYGHPADELYRPDRGSTLRAYHRHRVHADPFVAIGRQDLTAHVDLTALQRAATAAGLGPLGRTTQARFLADLGVGELLVARQAEASTTLQSYLDAKSALVRMLDPRATGGFAVMAFGRGLPSGAPLRGFGPAR
ncbi:MAG TPA: SAM-dependent methyltransferase [Candidatus Limnocylindrales bacterium]|nr:SAM-dependent methyltransferase [Candidatus Limnocylindrales bacterium]